MDAFTWCGRRDLTACCALLAGCLLGSHPSRLRTIRYSNGHKTFELRSCPHGFDSLFILCVQRKNTHLSMSVLPFGAVEGIRTPMVAHTDLNRARLPIPPYPQVFCFPWRDYFIIHRFAIFANFFWNFSWFFSIFFLPFSESLYFARLWVGLPNDSELSIYPKFHRRVFWFKTTRI